MQCEAPLLVALFCATNLQLMRGSCMASEEVQQGQVGSVVPLQLSMCWQQVACLTYFRGYLLGPSLAWRRCHFLAVCSKAWLLPHTHTHASVDLPGHRYACLCVCVCTSIKLSDHRKKKKCRREIVEQQRQLCCSSGICSSLGYSAGKSDRGRIGSKEGELYRIYIYVYILLKWAKRTLGLCTKLRRTGQRITNECKPCQGVSLVIWIWYKEC